MARPLHILSIAALAVLVLLFAALFPVNDFTDLVPANREEELRHLYNRRDFAPIERLAREGDAKAQAWMARIRTQQGRPAEADDWQRRAAENGDLESIGNLARMNLRDNNDEEAARWYRRGALLGDADMQAMLAWHYLQGRGVDYDERQAFRWYSAAADLGHAGAYLATAEMHAGGIGTTRDRVEAYARLKIALGLLSKSDTRQIERAQALKEQIAKELSPQQVEEARRKANARRVEWAKRARRN